MRHPRNRKPEPDQSKLVPASPRRRKMGRYHAQKYLGRRYHWIAAGWYTFSKQHTLEEAQKIIAREERCLWSRDMKFRILDTETGDIV